VPRRADDSAVVVVIERADGLCASRGSRRRVPQLVAEVSLFSPQEACDGVAATMAVDPRSEREVARSGRLNGLAPKTLAVRVRGAHVGSQLFCGDRSSLFASAIS